jgi:hypothetical protein
MRLRQRGDDGVVMTLTGTLRRQPKRIVLRPPLARPLAEVAVDGRAVDTFDAESVTIATLPAVVVMGYGS